MVPLCDIAFIPARLKHTNEVHVHLGDNHFVQRTAHECQPIINRRVEAIEGKLKLLKDQQFKQQGISDVAASEKKQADVAQSSPGGVPQTHTNENGELEIFEPYESDEELKPPVARKKSKVPKESKIIYVKDFDWGKPMTYAQARSPADLRMAME